MKKKINLLFLDFDGVVNTVYFSKENPSGNYYFPSDGKVNNYQAICWLNEIYKEVPYAIVVTSTWRMGLTTLELGELLYNSGLNREIKVIGKTLLNHEIDVKYKLPYDEKIYRQRGFEIDVWLKMHQSLKKEYDFKHFIILDDDKDMWKYSRHLIHCTANGFLTVEYGKLMAKWRKYE